MKRVRYDLPYEAFCRWLDAVEKRHSSDDLPIKEMPQVAKVSPLQVDFQPARTPIWTDKR